jgi:ATP-dependent Lon protease
MFIGGSKPKDSNSHKEQDQADEVKEEVKDNDSDNNSERPRKRLRRLNRSSIRLGLDAEAEDDQSAHPNVDSDGEELYQDKPEDSDEDERGLEDYESELDEEEKANIKEMFMEALQRAGISTMDDDSPPSTEWQDKIRASKIPDEWKEELMKRASDLDRACEDERHDVKTEMLLRRVLKIPFGTYTPLPKADTRSDKGLLLQKARDELNVSVYGMTRAKDEILNVLAQMLSGLEDSGLKQPKPRIFCLVSPPGFGKTHLATTGLKAVLNRPTITFSMAGMTDSTQLLGCSFFYEGAHPGSLYDALVTAKCMDPILVFDEVDKIAETAHGRALTNTLIHLTDPLANENIKDAYLAPISLDMSACTYVFLCNEPDNIPIALSNRMYFINIDPPTFQDRMHIVRQYIWKQVLNELKLNRVLNGVKLSESVIQMLLNQLEAQCRQRETGGMRGVKHMLNTLALTMNRQHLLGEIELNGEELAVDYVRGVIEHSGHSESTTRTGMSLSARMMYT